MGSKKRGLIFVVLLVFLVMLSSVALGYDRYTGFGSKRGHDNNNDDGCGGWGEDTIQMTFTKNTGSLVTMEDECWNERDGPNQSRFEHIQTRASLEQRMRDGYGVLTDVEPKIQQVGPEDLVVTYDLA